LQVAGRVERLIGSDAARDLPHHEKQQQNRQRAARDGRAT
jgi:hypothetical protein